MGHQEHVGRSYYAHDDGEGCPWCEIEEQRARAMEYEIEEEAADARAQHAKEKAIEARRERDAAIARAEKAEADAAAWKERAERARAALRDEVGFSRRWNDAGICAAFADDPPKEGA